MKKILLVFLTVSILSYGIAFPSTTVWDVQPGTGSNNNSCGYVPGSSGTDFSQQASPQFALTGVTSVGAGSIVLTASAAATMVGNLVQVISGTNFTTGFFQIQSVVVGVSISVTTRADGTAITTGAGALGVLNIGGTCATISTAVANASTGNIVYFKGTYTVTSALTFPVTTQNNDFGNQFMIVGYTSTHGDGGKATWTTATNSINLVDISSLLGAQFLNITFTNTAGTVGSGTTGNAITPLNVNAANIVISNCSFSEFNFAINADFVLVNAIVNLQVQNSEVKNSVSHGVQISGSAAFAGNFIHGNGGDGVRITTVGNNSAYNYTQTFFRNVIYLNGGNGITNTSSQVQQTTLGANVMLVLAENDIVSNTGDGVSSPANHNGATLAWNNIFWNNGGWGYNSPISSTLVNSGPFSNAYGSNTAGARQNFPAGTGDVTLTANPFTSIGSNFALNNTVGGGAALKGKGFPGAIPNAGSGTPDIGALQSTGSAGGGQVGYAIIQ